MDMLIDDRRGSSRGEGSDRRRNPRLRVLIAATLETADGEQTVTLRNLSRTGALLEGKSLPPLGSEVVFKRGKTRLAAKVVRVLTNQIGLHFEHPIEEAEVLIHVGRPMPGRR